jgi:hypothetical protein
MATFPALRTRKLKVIVSPTVVIVFGLTVFVTVSCGFGVTPTATLAIEGGEVTGGPAGGVPVAVAESSISPLFRSAWVTV